MRSWLTSAFLSLAIVLPHGALAPLPVAPALLVQALVAPALVMGAVAVVADPAPAEARASSGSRSSSRSSSSGGYSRPSGSSRTPSFSAPRSSSGSSSSSSGYRRPSLSPSPSVRPSPSPSSRADRELSRRQSGEALDSYRASRRPELAPPASSTYRAPPAAADRPGRTSSPSGSWTGSGSGSGSGRGYNTGGGWGGGWAPGRGWSPPGYAYNSPRRFGVWDGLFLWFLLDNLSRDGSADFFHNHRSDPGYQDWRAEAERRAQSDAGLRAKLDQLDQQLTQRQGEGTDATYLPPDTPPEVALAQDSDGADGAQSGGSGFGTTILILALLVGFGVFMLMRRARRRPVNGPAPASSPLGTAGRILRGKITDKIMGHRAEPLPFRVGMVLTNDPTPFILAQGKTKITPPAARAGGTVSVEAIGELASGGIVLHRLYLPGGQAFFQLHLDADLRPDECRYFSLLDEVHPASGEEWGFWLDPAEGMLGWPEFQTKDGKLYARHWSPGAVRIDPADFSETLTEPGGGQARDLKAMLYAASTGAAAPAPETEYILVAVVERAGKAWVEIHAGIDVNPATLSLA